MPDNPLHRVLCIDLTNQQYRVEEKPHLFEESVGGTGIAIRLLEEECPPGIDPLRPENPIVFAVGPLTGLFPLASKTVAMFKSPLTGNLGESHAGGRSAVSLRLAGYGAVVIKGASESPVYLSIHDDKVYFRDASALWGMTNSHTIGRVIREREPGSGTRTIMRIGRAGEQLVRYASVITETYRHFGRLGLGAVFGSKKLKAIVISGNRSLIVANPKQYRKTYDEIFQAAVNSSVMQKYHQVGTAENIEPLNAVGGLPTMNIKESRFDGAKAISGEQMAQQYLGRRIACAHCPIACIHIAALREPYEQDPYFYKTSMISYDYEPIYAMGSMLGVSDSRGLLKLLDDADRLGVDVMSAGVVLAWATEALEKGLIKLEDLAGAELKWGDHQAYRRALKMIVEQPNDLYRALARGVEYASSQYGGADFALALGGNEMPGYHTGPAAYAGFLMGSRHSHLDSAGYSIDLKSKNQQSASKIADALIAEETWRQILSSAVVCFFARGVYTQERIARAFDVAGCDVRSETLLQIGGETLRRKYSFKLREGFSPKKLRIPQRILETPSASGIISESLLRETVSQMNQKLTSL
ncbi:MAG: aldehyde ferredoxin oxidoreductase family protein [Chloroflexi bacterium]|nr:aldehyde ferredoxin oxidoreductase family protein [Chloroflexota bacterium]